MNEPISDKGAAIASQPVLKRDVSLIPGDTVTGRALIVVIAIMSFLACLTAGGALLIARASYGWSADVLQDITIQVKPSVGEDSDALVDRTASIAGRTPGVADVRPYSATESEKLLEPWLGSGLDTSLLPIPRVIVVHMQDQREEAISPLRAALKDAVPQANLDDNRLWASRIGTMASTIVALAVAVFALMIVAMAMAIGFATRGAVAANREIVEVLHFIGASEAFIAGEFQTHFQRLGLHGAIVGVSSAVGLFLSASALTLWSPHTVGREEIATMFGAFYLYPIGYATLVLIGVGVTVLTGLLSRAIVFRHLNTLE